MSVLQFVNRAIDTIGHTAFGLTKQPKPHEGDDRAGLVALWNPVVAGEVPNEDEGDDEDERDWLPAHDTMLAEKIAEQVRRWVTDEEP